ncbi:hypothetical protein CPC08DRAFT_708807 [Agrocybe pediades]|nr:hypothetical protein CPC08DRAFT_708807 [Agrocybe pediades]
METTIILVTGLSRAGKSTFINNLVKETCMPVNDTLALNSCSSIKSVTICPNPDRPYLQILVAEVPGFDDEVKGDGEKLKEVADWLQEKLSQKMTFGGVLYMHDISEDRFSTLAASELKALQASFAGKPDHGLERFVLVTTKWGRISEEKASSKESELKKNQWGVLINRSSSVCRFKIDAANKEVGYSSAWTALNLLLSCKSQVPDISDRLEEFKKLQLGGPKQEKSVIASMIRLIFGYSAATPRRGKHSTGCRS